MSELDVIRHADRVTFVNVANDISTWLTAVIGSIILLVLYRVVIDRNDGRTLRT
jgi:hypothetical protein